MTLCIPVLNDGVSWHVVMPSGLSPSEDFPALEDVQKFCDPPTPYPVTQPDGTVVTAPVRVSKFQNTCGYATFEELKP